MENIESQQVDPRALKNKELAEARAVFEKHGMLPPENKGKQRATTSIVSRSQISETGSKKSEGGKSNVSYKSCNPGQW